MKLILTQEVTGLGDPRRRRRGQGRLRPQLPGARAAWPPPGPRAARSRSPRSARPASRREIADVEDAQRDQAVARGHARARCPVNAGAAGRLFGAVTPADVADAVKAATGTEVDRRKVEIAQPIKSLGAHQVTVRLHADVQATIDARGRPGVVTPWTW